MSEFLYFPNNTIKRKVFNKAEGNRSFNTVYSPYIQFCISLGSAGGLKTLWEGIGEGSFGLSCRTKVQELTLMERAKEFLRAKQEESINS